MICKNGNSKRFVFVATRLCNLSSDPSFSFVRQSFWRADQLQKQFACFIAKKSVGLFISDLLKALQQGEHGSS